MKLRCELRLAMQSQIKNCDLSTCYNISVCKATKLENHFAKKSQTNQPNTSQDPDDDVIYFHVKLPEHIKN